ncbi:uncharacterized protein, partial [Cicer arietinum]|uniref:Uncharacterized protein LOC101501357 n=1 Tax=Cicer arietinum TaxID=3827 RepID=A0A1S2Z4I8_CICAR
EFERILGYSLERGNPYRYTGQPPKLDTIAEVLKIDIRALASTKEEKGAIHGFSRKYLEQKCQDLADKKEWSTFIDVLALIIYGIVIFPNLDNFVDFAAINVFLAFNKHKQNPVPAVLADIYYSMHMRHEKKGGTILCCVPVLYTWFVSHMFKKGYHVGVKSNREWAQSITSLTEDTISWYYSEQGVEEVICRCGDFPNVPLRGTKGCINYNPMVALRQLGYPMLDKPDDKSLEAFVLHNTGIVDPPMLRRISRAWESIIRKGKVLGCRGCSTKEPYQQWVKKRVQEIKLPFHSAPSNDQEMPEPILVANEEIEELKASLLKSEEEKKELQARLEKVSQENDNLRSENTCKKMEASSELRNYIDYQQKIYNDLKDETIYWEERFMVLLEQLKNQEIYKELEDKGKHWKDCFSKLAMLAN